MTEREDRLTCGRRSTRRTNTEGFAEVLKPADYIVLPASARSVFRGIRRNRIWRVTSKGPNTLSHRIFNDR